MTGSTTYPFPDSTWEGWRERRINQAAHVGSGTMEELRELVHNYNEMQALACCGIRMDPYTPCNGSTGNLCMQCPRLKGVALVPTRLPG